MCRPFTDVDARTHLAACQRTQLKQRVELGPKLRSSEFKFNENTLWGKGPPKFYWYTERRLKEVLAAQQPMCEQRRK